MIDLALLGFFLFLLALETIFMFKPLGWASLLLGLFVFLFAVYGAISSLDLPVQPWFSVLIMIWSALLMLRSAGADF